MINPKTDRNMIVVTEAKKCLTLMFNLCKKLHVKKKKKYKYKSFPAALKFSFVTVKILRFLFQF